MHNAVAKSRLVAPALALALLATGCAQQAPHPPLPSADSKAASVVGGAVAGGSVAGGPVAAAPAGSAQQQSGGIRSARVSGSDSAPEDTYLNPASGRLETLDPDISSTAVLIGDSQGDGAAGVPGTLTWTRTGLAALGYKVDFCGRGGTGFVASNGKVGNYVDALEVGDWKIPYGTPPLVVIEGGGNDAARGATDAQIVANADRLLKALRQSYPTSHFVMIGTLAKGSANGGGRRSQVDALLGNFASSRKIPFVSAGDWLTRYNLTNELADGVHLKLSGHQKLAPILTAELDKLGLSAADLESRASAAADAG